MQNRIIKKEVKIGNITIGGSNKIAIQSMTNTKTSDIEKTSIQIERLVKAGCDIVRVAVLDMDDALAIKSLKDKFKDVAIVADIHFDYLLALASIDSGVDKIRLNPGNIDNIEHIKEVVNKCKLHNIPIRIGVNTGSIDKEIFKEYGRTALALCMSAKKHVDILEALDFHNIVISIKASDVLTTIDAYKMASSMFPYPLHVGVTEAGTLLKGSISSAVAISNLLMDGIGDTIRVSLTDDPVKEVEAAKEILSSIGMYKKPTLVSCPTCGRCQYNMVPIAKEIDEFLKTLGNVDIKVAVMGCAVNGPGEAKDADIGIAGGNGEALIFKKGEIYKKVPETDIVVERKREILELIKK